MDFIIEKFKNAKLKSKAVFILAVIIFIFIALGRVAGNSTDFIVPDETTTLNTTVPQTSVSETTIPETTTETVTETTLTETTIAETSRTGIDPDFKAFWDSYEKFIDSYVKMMKDPSAIYSMEYLNMVAEYAEWAAKVDDYDEENLTAEEIKYMNEVNARVASKMIGVAVS